MTTIAHLSDLHLLEDDPSTRPAMDRLRLWFLAFGRAADPARRRRRVAAALERAYHAGADHLVVTGDLTEDGHDDQFVVLAEMLRASRFRPDQVTLVPGNHDAYTDDAAWDRALRGPLAPYAPTSAPGAVTALADVSIVALSTARNQSAMRAAGVLDRKQLECARAELERCAGQSPVVLAIHHPPEARLFGLLDWMDGLDGYELLEELLHCHDRAFVLHGHTHVEADRPVRAGAAPRVFSASAVAQTPDALRLYTVRSGKICPEATGIPVGAIAAAENW